MLGVWGFFFPRFFPWGELNIPVMRQVQPGNSLETVTTILVVFNSKDTIIVKYRSFLSLNGAFGFMVMREFGVGGVRLAGFEDQRR